MAPVVAPVPDSDHGPSPAALTARTCTSQVVPEARPVSAALVVPAATSCGPSVHAVLPVPAPR